MEKTDKKRRFRKAKKKTNQKHKSLTSFFVFGIFVLSLSFYCVAKIGIVSYNITLAEEEQSLQNDVYLKEENIEELQSEVRSIKNKKKLLGMLEDDESESINSNEDNVYFMGDSTTR